MSSIVSGVPGASISFTLLVSVAVSVQEDAPALPPLSFTTSFVNVRTESGTGTITFEEILIEELHPPFSLISTHPARYGLPFTVDAVFSQSLGLEICAPNAAITSGLLVVNSTKSTFVSVLLAHLQ